VTMKNINNQRTFWNSPKFHKFQENTDLSNEQFYCNRNRDHPASFWDIQNWVLQN
jgi:hypothetical protein